MPGQQFSQQQQGSGPPCAFVGGAQPGPNPNMQNFAYQQAQQQQTAPQQQAPNQTYNPYLQVSWILSIIKKKKNFFK